MTDMKDDAELKKAKARCRKKIKEIHKELNERIDRNVNLCNDINRKLDAIDKKVQKQLKKMERQERRENRKKK